MKTAEKAFRIRLWVMDLQRKKIIWRRDWLKRISLRIQFKKDLVQVNKMKTTAEHQIKITEELKVSSMIRIKPEDQQFIKKYLNRMLQKG